MASGNMRRGYTVEDYRRLVEKIRQRIPGVSIATDIIVGFPGESEEQFQHTYDLLADLRWTWPTWRAILPARGRSRPGGWWTMFLRKKKCAVSGCWKTCRRISPPKSTPGCWDRKSRCYSRNRSKGVGKDEPLPTSCFCLYS